VLRKFRPTRIFVSHPADAHPDHRAWYLYTMVTLWETPDLPMPIVHPYLIHHKDWPVPSTDPPATPLDPPSFFDDEIAWQRRPLDATTQSAKRSALEAHATQMAYSREFMLGFVRRNELFGDFAPAALRQPDGARDLLAGPATDGPDSRAQVSPETRASFVGIEWRHVERHGGLLTLTADLSRRLLPGTHAVFYLFGARPDRPFAGMPKVRVTIGPLGVRVANQDAPLPDASVTVDRSVTADRKGRRLTVTVPVALLGDPQRVLIGADTDLADLPMHPAGWRIVELGGWPAPGSPNR
jgi:hypothetical protein